MPWAGYGGEIMTLSVLFPFLWFPVFSFSYSLFFFLYSIPSAFVGEVVVGLCKKVWILLVLCWYVVRDIFQIELVTGSYTPWWFVLIRTRQLLCAFSWWISSGSLPDTVFLTMRFPLERYTVPPYWKGPMKGPCSLQAVIVSSCCLIKWPQNLWGILSSSERGVQCLIFWIIPRGWI